MNDLFWLQDWYQSYCDGVYEPLYGISIVTLDNPGWNLKIYIVDTKLLGKKYELKSVEIDDLNWYRCWVEDGFFRGVGGVQNLVDIIRCFRQWVEE